MCVRRSFQTSKAIKFHDVSQSPCCLSVEFVTHRLRMTWCVSYIKKKIKGANNVSLNRKGEVAHLLRQLSPQQQTEFLETFWQHLSLAEKATIYARYVADVSPQAWTAERELLASVLIHEK